MVDLGALYNVTQHLLYSLREPGVRQIWATDESGVRQIWATDELERTLSTLSDMVRRQAEVQPVLSIILKSLLVKLRDVVYKADDVVDELLTRVNINTPAAAAAAGGRCFPTVRRRKIQYSDLIAKLDSLWELLGDLTEQLTPIMGFQLEEAPPDRRAAKRETTSYVDPKDVVGREDDLNKVVDLLLKDSNRNHEYINFGFLAIVGSAGVGKTSLAKLVYNDTRIQDAFPTRLWLVSSKNDQDVIFPKVAAAIEKQRESSSSLKMLVIIDDVGNRLHLDVADLGGLLSSYEGGSAIVITTRWNSTAQNVGEGVLFLYGDDESVEANAIYGLKGLSEESSWELFQMAANPPNYNEYVEMGRNIVQKCFNLPFAINVVGHMLCGADKTEWMRLQKLESSELFQLPEVMSVSRLSYDKLDDMSLKCCFSYCAIFPDNFVISKRMLISLWMAQDYIQLQLNERKTLQDVTEDYFDALLQNGLFEIVDEDEYGEVISCKINNWMHQVAKYIADKEICVTKSDNEYLVDGNYHIFDAGDHNGSGNSSTIRSYIQQGISELSMITVVQQWTTLRTLALQNSSIKHLPHSIGKLFRLRYLDLSHNKFLDDLPGSIVNLCNLKSLDLRFCGSLKQLPQEFCKLTQLISLDLFGCDGLSHMPPGLDKLTRLELLSQFVVAEDQSIDKQSHGQLRDLEELTNLRGRICVTIPASDTRVKRMDVPGFCLLNMRYLNEVWVRFLESHSAEGSNERIRSYHQTLLARLTPHGDINGFILWGYQGETFPWGEVYDERGYTPLYDSNTVKFELRSCDKLQQLPSLLALKKLKSLKLHGLRNLVFLQDVSAESITGTRSFSTLEQLELVNAPRLKGIIHNSSFPREAEVFRSLVRLEVRSCEKLQHLPYLSELSHLKTMKISGLSNLEYLETHTNSDTFANASVSEFMGGQQSVFFPSLESLEIGNAAKLRGFCAGVNIYNGHGNYASWGISCFPRLKYLMLVNLPEFKGFFFVKNGDDYEQVDHLYLQQFGFLSEFRVSSCPKLMSIPIVPSLDSLDADNIRSELLNHIISAQGSLASLSTTTAKHTVRSLSIVSVNDLENLAITMLEVESLTIRRCQNLCDLTLNSSVSVRKLTIQECAKLKYISPVLQHLSSLEELEIEGSQDLDWGVKEDNVSAIEALKSLKKLRSLKLINISKCESVLICIEYLSSLERLHISWLCDLRALPNSIHHLSKLRHLSISHCPNFTVFPESLCRLTTLEMLDIKYCCRLKIPERLHNKSSQLEIRIFPASKLQL